MFARDVKSPHSFVARIAWGPSCFLNSAASGWSTALQQLELWQQSSSPRKTPRSALPAPTQEEAGAHALARRPVSAEQ